MRNKTYKVNDKLELNIIDLKGKDYLPVQERILWFRTVNPEWSIETEVNYNETYCVAKATIKNEDGRIIATGFKREDQKHFQDYIEKAETGSIGRCLALTGYGTAFASELSEGIKSGELGIVDSPRVDNSSSVQDMGSFNSRERTEFVRSLSGEAFKSLLIMLNESVNMDVLKEIWTQVSKHKEQLNREQYAELLRVKDKRKSELSKVET